MPAPFSVKVLPGLENTSKLEKFKKGRIALLTNRSCVTSSLERNLDFLLGEGFKIEIILSPEHGFYTQWGEREIYGIEIDEKTGIPIYPLYPQKDIPNILEPIDVVFVDLQDVGARFYTYLTSLKDILTIGEECGLAVVVLDRPNPLTGILVESPILDMRFSSFVGCAPLPVRYGLTIGELGKLFVEIFDIGVEYDVCEMIGWNRNMWFDETELPWVPPSPNIPTPDTALVYLITCFLEGTNVSEGRGTPKPFFTLGAPWIDPFLLKENLDSLELPGIKFLPHFFIPSQSKYKNQLCGGVEIYITNREVLKPVEVGFHLLKTLHSLHREFEWIKNEGGYFIDFLVGTDKLRKLIDSGGNIEEFIGEEESKISTYRKIIEKLLIY
jgi:uncharacterized protein YbbC (DUF1343 family)